MARDLSGRNWSARNGAQAHIGSLAGGGPA
jgi:hypothetical protein